MTNSTRLFAERVNWGRAIVGGLTAGLVINTGEYGGHGLLLNDPWTAAFHALGRAPTGWSTYIPGNFAVGIFMVWLYVQLRPWYGTGPKTALRSGLAVWAVFWVIPMLAIMPMGLFPNTLLAIVMALGFVDVSLAVLLGAWICR
jgi:hypothetical protein